MNEVSASSVVGIGNLDEIVAAAEVDAAADADTVAKVFADMAVDVAVAGMPVDDVAVAVVDLSWHSAAASASLQRASLASSAPAPSASLVLEPHPPIHGGW
jgi:hypothetical protein